MKSKNPLISDDSIHAILQIASAFRESKILLTACEFNLFSIIENDQKTAKEIAIEAGTNEKATERLLNALVSMNLLVKNGMEYSNTKGTRRFLVDTRPEYIGNMMFFTNQWDKWNELSNSLKTGKAVKYECISQKDEQWTKSYVDSIYWRALMEAPDIVSSINLSHVDSMLDLACGSGIYSIEFKKAKPSLKVSAMDFPNVIKEAGKHIEREGLKGEIELLSGDMYKDTIPGKYDMVFLSHVLGEYPFWQNVQLMHKIYDILNPGGQIVIQETIIDDSKTSPESATISSISFLVNTPEGDVFTETDLWMMLKEGWFEFVSRRNTPFDSSIIIGKK